MCGNDEPVNLDRTQTRLLALLTHGTAMVRRALSVAGCLTIVSGNIGAFRRTVLDEVGMFTPGLVGEDLELTWRVHRAGYQVRFCPRALVYAEVPATVSTLWRQRVRWTRGLVQTARMHRDMLFDPARGRIGWYLPYNLVTMLVLPVLQLVGLALGLASLALGGPQLLSGLLLAALLVGIVVSLVEICYAVALDRAWRDLRFLYALPAWLAFSLLMSAVVVWSLAMELRGSPAAWNKMTRSGVISRPLPTRPGAAAA